MRTALSLLGLTTLLALASACSSGSSGACTSSRDCAMGEACVSGACMPAAAKDCTDDQNCDFGQICMDGSCVEIAGPTSCTSDNECGSKQRCNTLTGVCIDRGPACSTEAECSGGLHCDAGAGSCVECLDTSHCGSGEICMSGSCEPNTSGVCSTDTQCSPPSEICVAGACVLGCGQPNGVMCMNGEVCDTNNGRCVSIRGPCTVDPECSPPLEVCEFGQCIPGCTEFGGVQCPGGQQCNPSTGRCIAVGDICLSDLECMTPAEICNLTSGACDPGCGTTGCTSPATCDAASGHCTGATACNPDRLEPNDSFATASPAGGLQAQLTICSGDVDFHRFTLNGGDDATITADFVHGEGNIDIELVDANGAVVAMSSSTNNTEMIQFTAVAAGDYAARVFLRQDLGPNPGNTYSIRIDAAASPCPEDSFEDNDSGFLAPFVSDGNTPGLNVCDGDDDYFDVFVDAGETVTVTARFANAEGDIDLALLGFLNIPLVTSAGSSDNETVMYTQEDAGFITILVTLYQDQGSMPGNPYELDIVIGGAMPMTCAVDSLEENDSRTAASAITPGVRSNLNTCTGDEDFYAIALAASDEITATASFSTGEGDIDLELLDGSGSVLDSASTTGGTETVSFTVPTAGTYFVRVVLFQDSGSATGNTYSLDVSVNGSNPPQCVADSFEPNNSIGAAPAIALGTYNNLGQCGDDDFYAFNLITGDSLNIGVAFTHSEGDIDIELYGPDGTVAASSETTTNNESIGGTANVDGTFTLRVFLYQDSGSVTGNTYQLTLTP